MMKPGMNPFSTVLKDGFEGWVLEMDINALPSFVLLLFDLGGGLPVGGVGACTN
ncbi:hypothetical protein COLO4_28805 [Corchorus olitorius]|uniref:Uncharacterized protein n=1 Tax=Corchorus olitorius TaxID=93759 RepID=A0A1R3HI70_9ROSI|nr:hypothetical protein COLO4_28805 [Corchorus olitorius]